MNWLRNQPVGRILTFVILLSCSVVLLLACGVLAAYQLYDFHQMTVHDSTVLADVLARNTQAALTFQDEAAATQTLEALQAEPYVSAACLYTALGAPFATYVRPGLKMSLPPAPGALGYRFERGHLALFRPVLLNNHRIGTLFLQTDSRGMYDRLRLFLGIAALVLLGSVFIALALSSSLQRPVSRPIIALAETARRIAEHKDYSVRAPVEGRNEIGSLTENFNQLVESIEERDRALRTANENLRGEIAERRSAEGRVQAQLARLEMLHRITRATSERQDLESVFQVVIRTLEDQLSVDFCCVSLYEAEANRLTVISVGPRSEPLARQLSLQKQARLDVDANGLLRCVRGHLVHEPDISGSESAFPRKLAGGGLRSVVLAPLLVESKVFGALIAARRQPHSFSSGECEFLRQLSEHVALAAHQAQLYEALQQAYDDLRQTQQAIMQQERLKALGQMASGIAHDINNAISPVALYTESLLENEPNLSRRARDYLTTIQHAIEDVAQTVARMREFYRQREQPAGLLPVKVNDLVGQVIELSRARWSDMPQQRGAFIRLETDLAADLPLILGVESEIREALVNLVFNAVDAMPGGGALTLRTRLKAGPPPLVLVEVADTGVGMDEDTRRRCLEPFFTTKGERGTGLGLAMVYGIARRHNADIEIFSAPGQGTTVRLHFPVPSSQVDEPGRPPAVFKLPARLRILIVDDDPLIIRSLRDTLESDGHLVVTANGGQDGTVAFRKARESQEPFDVVITDLGMPHIDGRQVAAAVKNASPSTPVILLTGWGQRLLAEGDVPPHVDRVLNKPPKLRELREALAQSLQGKKL